MLSWLFGTAPRKPEDELAEVHKTLRRRERKLNRESERAQMESEAATILAKNAAYAGQEQVARMLATKAVRKGQSMQRYAILQAQVDEQMETAITQETYAGIQEATKHQTRAIVRSVRSMPQAEFNRMNLAYTQATEILRTRKDEIHNTNETILEDVETEDADLEGVDEMMAELLDGKDLEELGSTIDSSKVSATMGMARVSLGVLDPDPEKAMKLVYADVGTPLPANTWNLVEFFGNNVREFEWTRPGPIRYDAHFAWQPNGLRGWYLVSENKRSDYSSNTLTLDVLQGVGTIADTVGLYSNMLRLHKEEHQIFILYQSDRSFFLTLTRQSLSPVPLLVGPDKRPAKRGKWDASRASLLDDMLPREMIVEILRHLDSVQLFQCEYVCKSWTELARQARSSLVIQTIPHEAVTRYPNLRSLASLVGIETHLIKPMQNHLTALNLLDEFYLTPKYYCSVRKVVLRTAAGVLSHKIPPSTEHLVIGRARDAVFLWDDQWVNVTRLDLFGTVNFDPSAQCLMNSLVNRSHFPNVTTMTWNNTRSIQYNDTACIAVYPHLKRWSLNQCLEIEFHPTLTESSAAGPQLERLYLHHCDRVMFYCQVPLIPTFASLRYLLVTPLGFSFAVGWHLQDLICLEELHIGYSNKVQRTDDFWLHLAKLTSNPVLRRFVCFNLFKSDVVLSPEAARAFGGYGVSTRSAPLEVVLVFQDFPQTGQMAPLTLHLDQILTPATTVVVKKGLCGDPCLTPEDYDMVFPQFLARREWS